MYNFNRVFSIFVNHQLSTCHILHRSPAVFVFRYTQRQGLMKVLTSEAKDLSIDQAGQLNGETSAKLVEDSVSTI